MLARAALIVTLGLAASAAGAGGVPAGKDWAALLISAVEANGCQMKERDAPMLLEPLGFERDWTAQVLQEVVNSGQAELELVDGMPILRAKTKVCGA